MLNEINNRWNTEYYIPEKRIATIIKGYMRNQEPHRSVEYKIMLRNGNIIGIGKYRAMIETKDIDPSNAYVYIVTLSEKRKSFVRCPYLFDYCILVHAILSKLGFDIIEFYDVVPAVGLTYLATVVYYSSKYLVIDLVNLVNVINRLNLYDIVREYNVEDKKLAREAHEKLDNEFWRLFRGLYYTVYDYYDEGNKNLKEKAERIEAEYNRVFQSYKVCYELPSWKEVSCSPLK